MTLLELLVQELPKRGGWEFGGDTVFQDYDGEIRVVSNNRTFTGLHLALCDCYRESGFSHVTLPEYAFVTRDQYEDALAASKQPEWDGVGLPPVGEVIEYSCIFFNPNRPAIEKGQWYKGTVIAYYDDCVWTSDNGIRPLDNTQFRPIRTEAERKRKEIAQQMCNMFGNGIEIDEKEGYGKAWLDVYDAIAAGKIPGIKLAD